MKFCPRAVSAVLLLAWAPLHAASISVAATGTLDYSYNPYGLFPAFELGAPVTLTVTYDSESPDGMVDYPNRGRYGGPTMQLQVGDTALAGYGDRYISVYNNVMSGTYFGDSWHAWTFVRAGDLQTRFSLELNDFCEAPCPASTALDSDALVAPPWPADWSSAYIVYQISDDRSGEQLALASSIVKNIAVVPLPSAVWLLGTAVAGIAGRRWIRR